VIGFLGAGSMTESLMRGLLEGGVVLPQQVLITNRGNRERLEQLVATYGVRIAADKVQVAAQADILVVACKPKDVPELLDQVGALTRSGQLLLSLAAGISTTLIGGYITPGVQVIRAMPNTSCTVGESATAFCPGAGASEEAMLVARAILGAVGQVVQVPESAMDAVTGLSGTGPAYVYLLIESLIEAGQAVGLPFETARELAVQTLRGAGKMLAETGEEPAVLRQRVTSPGGTTMAAM
jgi:pyrroline-5-carboxylate reductase